MSDVLNAIEVILEETKVFEPPFSLDAYNPNGVYSKNGDALAFCERTEIAALFGASHGVISRLVRVVKLALDSPELPDTLKELMLDELEKFRLEDSSHE